MYDKFSMNIRKVELNYVWGVWTKKKKKGWVIGN